MKKNLIIISAGAFAREVYLQASRISKELGDECPWQFKGFLDNRSDVLKGKELESAPILSSVEDYQPQSDDVFVSAIGNVYQRRKYVRMIKQKGGRFERFFAPSAILAGRRRKRLKPGLIVAPFSIISADVRIGRHTVISDHTTLGHDVSVGSYSHIGAFVFIGGGAQIGKLVTIHPHATILPGAVIEDKAIVGAGSVVISRVKRGETVFGVPAQPVRT